MLSAVPGPGPEEELARRCDSGQAESGRPELCVETQLIPQIQWTSRKA